MRVDGEAVGEVIPSQGDGRRKGKLLRNNKGLVLLLDIFLRVQNPSLNHFACFSSLWKAGRPAQAVWACPRLQRDLVA